MRTRKEIREAIGWTYETQSSDPLTWYREPSAFHDAAVVLHNHEGRFTRVFAFNAGLSLELALKAILVGKGIRIPKTHELPELADLAKIDVDEDQSLENYMKLWATFDKELKEIMSSIAEKRSIYTHSPGTGFGAKTKSSR